MTRRCCSILWLLVWLCGTGSATAGPTGTFIQLNRRYTERTGKQWRADLAQMRKIGIRLLIVQWCAEPGISYFLCDLPYQERYDTVRRILAAAAAEEMKVSLGLHGDPHYWTRINARKNVLRDYFLIRVSQNEKLQKALLQSFAFSPAWTGYYIPDEIDDLTWREPAKAGLIRSYVNLMCDRLRINDPDRLISMSAFFRGRTAPQVFAKTMLDILDADPLDRLLLQDGTGVGDPGERYTPVYFASFNKRWDRDQTKLVCTLEAFKQVSSAGDPFAAVPADPARMRRQIDVAENHFKELVLFTFSDYVDPVLGSEAAALFEELSK